MRIASKRADLELQNSDLKFAKSDLELQKSDLELATTRLDVGANDSKHDTRNIEVEMGRSELEMTRPKIKIGRSRRRPTGLNPVFDDSHTDPGARRQQHGVPSEVPLGAITSPKNQSVAKSRRHPAHSSAARFPLLQRIASVNLLPKAGEK